MYIHTQCEYKVLQSINNEHFYLVVVVVYLFYHRGQA